VNNGPSKGWPKSSKSTSPLAVVHTADGLYPNKTFMQTCQKNGWSYVVVLKDDNLKILLQDIADTENKQFHSLENYTCKLREGFM